MKMSRRVDVRTPLAHMAKLIHLESVLLDRVERALLHLAEPFPVRRIGPERVREIDEALAHERRVDLVEPGDLGLIGGARLAAKAKAVRPAHRWILVTLAPLNIDGSPKTRRQPGALGVTGSLILSRGK